MANWSPNRSGGRGVFILRSSYAKGADGRTTVTGTIDCFVQIESLGADLIARTLSGLIGRSADHNFIETARFISQVSQASEQNPPAMIDVATRIPQVSESTRGQFIQLITAMAAKGANRCDPLKRPGSPHRDPLAADRLSATRDSPPSA